MHPPRASSYLLLTLEEVSLPSAKILPSANAREPRLERFTEILSREFENTAALITVHVPTCLLRLQSSERLIILYLLALVTTNEAKGEILEDTFEITRLFIRKIRTIGVITIKSTLQIPPFVSLYGISFSGFRFNRDRSKILFQKDLKVLESTRDL